jgi:hypothetical protein
MAARRIHAGLPFCFRHRADSIACFCFAEEFGNGRSLLCDRTWQISGTDCKRQQRDGKPSTLQHRPCSTRRCSRACFPIHPAVSFRKLYMHASRPYTLCVGPIRPRTVHSFLASRSSEQVNWNQQLGCARYPFPWPSWDFRCQFRCDGDSRKHRRKPTARRLEVWRLSLVIGVEPLKGMWTYGPHLDHIPICRLGPGLQPRAVQICSGNHR